MFRDSFSPDQGFRDVGRWISTPTGKMSQGYVQSSSALSGPVPAEAQGLVLLGRGVFVPEPGEDVLFSTGKVRLTPSPISPHSSGPTPTTGRSAWAAGPLFMNRCDITGAPCVRSVCDLYRKTW